MANPDRTPRRRLRRSWPQRLVIAGNAVVVIACLSAALAVRYSNTKVNSIRRFVVVHDSVTLPVTGDPTDTTAVANLPNRPVNFLLVGADSREDGKPPCISPDSPYYGGLYGQKDTGDQSDTIMIVRVEPAANQAAIMSFPRDLWVPIAGTGYSSRINSAYRQNDPSRLVRTIEEWAQVPIDHTVLIDFCAFKHLVDAVGGVRVPFLYPARDHATGFTVAGPSCELLDGERALAYARSRDYEWSTNGGVSFNHSDDTADRGRIRRQQDFIKRVMQKAIDKGARNPKVAASLLNIALKDVQLSSELKVGDLLDLANALHSLDPARVRSYRIDGADVRRQGESVIDANINSTLNKQILAIFRGQIRLADAPDPSDTSAATSTTLAAVAAVGAASTTATASTSGKPTTVAGGASGPTTAAATTASNTAATTTVPVVDVTQEEIGYAPPDDPTCR